MDRVAAALSVRIDALHGPADHLADFDLLLLQVDLPLRDARNIQKIVNQSCQPVGLTDRYPMRPCQVRIHICGLRPRETKRAGQGAQGAAKFVP